MKNKRLDRWLMPAKEALEKTGIAQDGKVDNLYRSQLSFFGAIMMSGSLKSAAAFCAAQGACAVERPRLLQAIYYVISGELLETEQIVRIICATDRPQELTQQFKDASVALKLAFNFFDIGKGGDTP